MSNKFKAPLNIKQMGNIDQDANINIYIEDYAYTYLQQYVKAGNYNERLAFLIGKLIKEDNKNIILISGAVNTKYTQHNDGIINITKETWNYVYDQIEKYFNGLEVMGLMQSQPGYGSYLNEKYISQFRNNFNKLYQVYLLCDPIENLNSFYIFDKMRENLEAIKGYFIYYEKNNAMNDYMIDNKEIKASNSSSDQIEKQEPPEITIRKRQFDRVQKSNNDQKKIVNMLASLSAVLFLICFIMGTGLVQNEDRISKLESQLKALNNSYKELSENNKIESVFSFSDSASANANKNNNNSSPEKNLTPKIIKDINNNKSQEDNLSNVVSDSSFSLDKEKNKDKDNKLLDNSLDNLTKPELESELKSNNKNKTNGQHESKLNNKSDSTKTYVVKDGDTLSLISQKFFGNTSMVDKIIKINNMDDADKIYVGKVLKLP